jgi:WhiB family redox-sensing transcriptional regulator
MKYPDFSSALCREIGLELFFPDGKGDGHLEEDYAARKLCASCPVVNECAEWGIAHEIYGIWGGLTPQNRRTIRRQRGIVVEQILLSDYV